MSIVNYNKNKCLARLTSDINKQCINNKSSNDKYFCGIHMKTKNKIRIDQNIELVITNNKLLSLDDIENINYNKIKHNDIKYTLNYYNIEIIKKKKIDFSNLSEFLTILNNYNISKIIKIQSIIRRFITYNRNMLKGPGLFKRNLINNEHDFLTFNSCKLISYDKFFSFIDNDNFIYAFNIDSIKYLVDNGQTNPYNRNSFPKQCIKNLNKLILLNNNFNMSVYFDEPKDEKSKMKQKCLKIFQRMDELELYTQPRWFFDLSTKSLIKLYLYIEDIWNYRAFLTKEMKKKYTKTGSAFNHNILKIKLMKDKLNLQNIILDEFEHLVFEGSTKDDCITSSYWILTALTSVSKDAAEGCSELVQSNVI